MQDGGIIEEVEPNLQPLLDDVLDDDFVEGLMKLLL